MEKIRNLTAYLCVGMVYLLFVYSLGRLFLMMIIGETDVYATAKTVLYWSWGAAIVFQLGAWVCKAGAPLDVSVVAGCGGCGVGLMFLLGLTVAISGFFAGCIWGPLLYLVGSIYGALFIYCVNSYFVRKIQRRL